MAPLRNEYKSTAGLDAIQILALHAFTQTHS
jgi:hypothetical protein